MAFPSDLRAIARALGGEVVGRQVVAPGPGHSPRDRSLSVTISAAAREGFLAFSHAGDDFAECRDHVKARLGIDRRQQENRPQTPPRRPTQPPRDDDRDARALMFAKQIAFEMRPILGTPGETYPATSARSTPKPSPTCSNEPTASAVAFKVSRLTEFCSERELQNQTGHYVDDWPLVVRGAPR